MNTKLMASVSTLALVLNACASQEPKPLAETPEVIYKTAKVNAAVSVIPSWYNEMPEKKGSIFTVGSATAPDLQLAVDIATLNGKVVLADRINGKLKAMTKSWIAKFGQSDVDARVMTEIEKVAKNVIANVDVAGYNVSESKVVSNGNQYRVYVLLEYSDENAQKILLNRLKKDRMLVTKLKANEAFKELENDVSDANKAELDRVDQIIKTETQ